MSQADRRQRARFRRLRFAGLLQELCGMGAWQALQAADTLDVAAAVEIQGAAHEPNRARAQLRALAAMEALQKRLAATPAA